MYKISWFTSVLVFTAITGNAQFYYNDIAALQQTAQQQQLFKQYKIKQVNVISKEADGSITEGFSVKQTIAKNADEITVQSTTSAGNTSTFTSYFINNKISKTKTVANGVESSTSYEYNNDGLLSRVEATTVDTFMNSFTSEVHEWFYKGSLPVKMHRIKNKIDTLVVEFLVDEKTQQIIEEIWKKKGRTVENYSYFYNDKKQLTDIVRYNSRLQKMLPDFVFEYNDLGSVKVQTQVMANASNYQKWFYTYDERGLKIKEACYDKQKQPIGFIEYSYSN